MPEMKIDPKEKTLQLLCQLLEKNTVSRIILSKPQDKTVVRGEVKPVKLKGQTFLQLTRQMKDGKALHQNIALDQLPTILSQWTEGYRQWNLFTTAGEAQLLISSKGQI